ncbi:MAG: glycosyltransferase family 39 protein [Acidobacteriia bacterium]|nr:glycosyltransferase family 39 protein [Terriglobia bacterium]
MAAASDSAPNLAHPPDFHPTNRFLTGPALVAYIAAAKFLIHFASAKVYGPFIDELYFLACGQHLAWGYVDMPPLTAFQAWLTRHLFGDSMYSIRLFPSLAGAGLILITGAIARALGGKRFAQAIAALGAFISIGFLAFDSYLSMNSVEPLVWMGCALLVIKIIQTENTKLWLWFGVLAGIGMLNKDTMLLFGFALVAGLLLTPERRLMFNRWFLLGGVLAFIIFLPNLVWMIQHHFPHLELLANIKRNGRDIQFSIVQFLGYQAGLMHPATLPIWLLGLWSLLARREMRKFRVLGLAYLIALVALLLMHAKVYYLLPAYPMLLAAGGVFWEGVVAKPRLKWLKLSYAVFMVVTGALLAPTFLPILPPETYLRYTQMTHLAQPRIENRSTNALPQFFADRCGWQTMVEKVAQVYNSLSPEERVKTAIIGNDFGQTGAVDYYGPKYGLPKSIGTHLSNWYWGPRGYTGEIAIVLGDTKRGASQWFDNVEEVAEVGDPYAMRQEHFKILLCRNPKNGMTLEDVWPRIKNFN